jgi:hypothetical protein
MPRPTCFTQKNVEQRGTAAQVDPALVERLSRKAPVPDDRRERLATEVHGALSVYRSWSIAHRQELPARKVAALKPGLTAARKLLAWLDTQPQSLRMELGAAGLEHFLRGFGLLLQELVSNAKSRSSYWQGHTAHHRPAGEGEIGTWLRQGLTNIADRYFTTSTEREKRDWVVFVLKEAGVKYPEEKKNKKRFVGQNAAEPTSMRSKKSLPRRREDRKTRALARRLGDINI